MISAIIRGILLIALVVMDCIIIFTNNPYTFEILVLSIILMYIIVLIKFKDD